MGTEIIFVGRVPVDGRTLARGRSIRVADFDVSRARSYVPAVLVFGDAALEHVEPPTVHEGLRGLPYDLVGIPTRARNERVEAWVRGSSVRLISPERAATVIRALASRVPRPQIPLESWLPRKVVDADAERLASALARLHAPRVDRWAEEVGLSRFQLVRRTVRLLGATPNQLRLAFVAATFAAGRSLRLSADGLAAALGYSDGATLLRAIRMRRK